MGKHSPTPWTSSGPYIGDRNGWTIANTWAATGGADMQQANTTRIAACVNACEGLSTENLTDNLPIKDLVEKYNAAMKQNSEMLTALRQIATMPAAMHNIEAADKMSEMAWAAIAKAEGA